MANLYYINEDYSTFAKGYNEAEESLEILLLIDKFTKLDKNSPDFLNLEEPLLGVYRKYNQKLLKEIRGIIELDSGASIEKFFDKGEYYTLEDDYFSRYGQPHGLFPLYFSTDNDTFCYPKVSLFGDKTPLTYEDGQTAYPGYDEQNFSNGTGFFSDMDLIESLVFWRSIYHYTYDYSIGSGIHFVRKSYLNLITPDADPQVWYMEGDPYPYFGSLIDSTLQLTDELREDYWGGVVPSPQEATYNIDRLASGSAVHTDILSRRVYARLGYPVSDPALGWYMGVPWYWGSPYAFHNHYLRFYDVGGHIEPYTGGPLTEPRPISRPLLQFYPPLEQLSTFTFGLAKKIDTLWKQVIVDGLWNIGDTDRKIR